jgi:uncharacterized protein YecE (DUF72 family)
MKFGKVSNPEFVDWSYDESRWLKKPWRISKDFDLSKNQHLYIGGSVWVDKDLVGEWYPKSTKPSEHLTEYAKIFDSIELNSCFYQIPPTSTIQNWITKTPENFKFCPKVYSGISRFLPKTNIIDIQNQIRMLTDFGINLGCSFIQLPENFPPSSKKFLFDFLNNIPNEIPLAVEFRHKEWFSQTNESIFEELAHRKTYTVITDVGGRRDACHFQITGNMVIIRFVGNNLDSSDFIRIQKWAQIMKHWYENGVNTIYFFIHQEQNINMPVLAKHLAELWAKESIVPVQIFNNKMADIEPQMRLF